MIPSNHAFINICKNYKYIDYIIVDNDDGIEQKINLNNNTDYHIKTKRPCFAMYLLNEGVGIWIFYLIN